MGYCGNTCHQNIWLGFLVGFFPDCIFSSVDINPDEMQPR